MEINFEYNTHRDNLKIPEYGRHIHKLVDHCTKLEDEAERNKMAKAIITIMGNMNPHLRDVPDFQHKLWDQLFIMSNYELKVETPFPLPLKEKIEEKPEKLGYPQNYPKYRFYGNNIKKMIDVAVEWEDNEQREALHKTIGNHMKKCYLNWNKDTVDDKAIFNHLKDLSGGKIDLSESDITLLPVEQLLRKKRYVNKVKPKGKQRN